MKRLLIALLLAGSVATQAQVLRRAPGFSLPDLSYKQYDLADYRGKVVLLDIIQTNCPKCIEVTRDLAEIKQKYGDKVQVLTIVTLPDNPQTISAYIQRYGVRNPVLLDCGQVIGSYTGFSPAKPTVHFPHLFVIDKVGNIRRHLEETEVTMTNVVGAVEGALK